MTTVGIEIEGGYVHWEHWTDCPNCDGYGEVEYSGDCYCFDDCACDEGNCSCECTCPSWEYCWHCGGHGQVKTSIDELICLPHKWWIKEEHCGVECISGVYDASLEMPSIRYDIRSVINELEDYGAEFNNSGIHVHVGVKDWEWEDLVKLASTFYSHQDDIYRAFKVCPDREIDWCRKLNKWDLNQLKSKSYLEHGRYYGLNLESLTIHGTVEFRLFNGYMDDDYAIRAVEFSVGFVETVRDAVDGIIEWRDAHKRIKEIINDAGTPLYRRRSA